MWLTGSLMTATPRQSRTVAQRQDAEVGRRHDGLGPRSWTLSRSTPRSTPGISITKTNLTVTEGDRTGVIYLIVLDSQPTADVTVYICGYTDTDVSPDRHAKVFNTANWNTPPPVTVKAAEDTDTADETVTMTHTAVSADANYDGITISNLTVTVLDDETPQVTGV